MDDLRDEFIAETRETLETLGAQLVQWEKSPQDHSLIDSVFRFVHTVKGSCGFLDLPRLARLSHAAEEILSAARDGELAPSAGLVTSVLAVIDRIALLTDALESGESVADNDAALISRMLKYLPKADAAEGAKIETEIDSTDADTIDQDLGGRPRNQTVRVPLLLLDKLMNGVSDLVLARNEVSRQLRRTNGSAETEQAFTRLSSTVSEIRDAVSHMRMQPIERLFSALPRLVRDISIELEKDILLEVDGSDVEIDREMVESLRDPLTHILRNAADHGIESSAERVAAGKSPVGRITVCARQSGNQIVVDIKDDGRGIDVEKLRAKAVSRKIITDLNWQKLSEQERLALIFEAGLSTAEQVTSISGRGVGMDVVRTNVHAIGGSIDIDNTPGKGLQISLRLPLTLSIIPALMVKAGEGLYSLPRSSIVEIISASNQHVAIEYIGGLPIVNIRGQRLPFETLESVLGIEQDKSATETSGRTVVVVCPAAGAPFALDVDAVVDIEELVVKPVPPILAKSGIYAGTSLPDNGRPVLLLDTSGLAAAIGETDVEEREPGKSDLSEVRTASDASATEAALAFEDWDGAIRAIRLQIVDRMEDVLPSDIHEVAAGYCVMRDNELSEIVNYPVDGGLSEMKMLRLTDGSNIRYLAVKDIIDIFHMRPVRVSSQLPEIFEAIVEFDGKPVELLNAYHLFEGSAASDSGQLTPPLCFVEAAGPTAGWERAILAPLLTSAGYKVSFDEAERHIADVVLTRSEAAEPSDKTVRIVDTLAVGRTGENGVYKYNRKNLLAAIEATLQRSAG